MHNIDNMKVKIINSDKVATDMRFTATGPEAQIEGKWYSVNGNEELITDIRFGIRENKRIHPDFTNEEIRNGFGE